ncbi:Probable protein phosphatase 2C 23 [Striga hermonthica]|uniref:Probable protein phosphatase 2C 23 n=1 Tax=Striga hermonthica TaxID=68872 RepID=A0A9N7NT23_STRHE|nr:Probable protein phosphatase 2C 23 [Striga hermonthica]
MGNGLRKLTVCFAGDAGEISRRRNDAAVYSSEPPDEGLGHSYCYIPHDYPAGAAALSAAAPFPTISGAAVSANVSTPLSTDPFASAVLERSSAFEASELFSSTPLQPVPRSSCSGHTARSGPILRNSCPVSGPIEQGFLSGPIERGFISGPLDSHRTGPKKQSLAQNLRNAIPKLPFWTFNKEIIQNSVSGNSSSTVTSINSSSEMSLTLTDENDDHHQPFVTGPNLQWAQGKAGEDRVHIVISQENGWAFVGVYDGFNGPDATDFLSNNLYPNVRKELNRFLIGEESTELDTKLREKFSNLGPDSVAGRLPGPGLNHSEVLRSLSEALRKTEASYLEIADMMLAENPELALMGSCVLAMVIKGHDVYLMNVGDSRAVLARKGESGKIRRMNSEETMFDYCQLTMDHSTSVKEEVRRIRKAHRDDPFAVINGRVKGSLKVTRAFGAGFLKHPKWNNALLEMFRIDYIGTSPYITCSPSLYHHRLESNDKFLILSSDGLYQYFTNEEVVYEVESFMLNFPEGDPAQHLVKELLFRAAKQAGMDFHQLLDIPQGDRRRYHDDVSIIIISFEGSMWRSSL